MTPRSAVCGGLVLLVGLFSWAGCDSGESGGPAARSASAMSEGEVRERVQALLTRLDSRAYAAEVPTDEFLVKAFQVVHGRPMDALEFRVLKAVVEESQLERSDLLTMMLADSRGDISADVARELLDERVGEALADTRDVRGLTRRLRQTPLDAVAAIQRARSATAAQRAAGPVAPLPASRAGETYQTYFGYLHSHTGFSDGEGTPDQAYRQARQAGMDFFAVSDHSELLSTWFFNDEWAKLRAAAEAHDAPGAFATLWGFEYSNPLLGHALVLNTTDFTSAFSSVLLDDLYGWIQRRPAGFGTFNHPGNYDDIGLEFYHLELTSPGVVPQMLGIELWNGSDGFDRFYYENEWSGSAVSYLDVGNRNGWMLGALGGQDNHTPDWGAKNQFRTAVLATGLTREALIEAYRARRFYATEDRDLYLDVRVAGFPMGSRVSGVARQFTVTARDASGDTFSEIRIYRNGTLIDVSAVAGADVGTAFTDSATTPAYYYVIVRQDDDNDGNGRPDEAISSPIWIQ